MTIRIGALLAVGVLGCVLWWRNTGVSADSATPDPPLPVAVVTLTPATSHQQAYEYTGSIVAAQTSELGLERGGRLVNLEVDEGDRVTQNATLAILDTRALEAKRRQLQSQLEGAEARLRMLEKGPRDETIAAAQARVRSLEAQLQLQQNNFSRREELARSNAVSEEEVDQTRYGSQSSEARLAEAQEVLNELLAGSRIEEVDAQRAVVSQLEASLQSVEVDLEDSVLRSPFSGTITARYADPGTVVAATEPIFRLVDVTAREAHIGIPPEVALEIRPGDEVSVEVSGRPWPATVRTVLPELDMTTRTQTLLLDIQAGDDGQLPVAGEIARTTLIRTVRADGFWVPSTALERGQRGLWAVLALEPNDAGDWVVKRRDVELILSTANEALVRGTLSAGDQIVASGIHRLVPGQRVSVSPESL